MHETNQSHLTAPSQAMLPISEIVNKKLYFKNSQQLDLALKLGIFYLKIPENLDLYPGVQLAQNFYKDLDNKAFGYTGYRQRRFEKSTFGYTDRANQVEQLQLEINLWDEFFPKEVANLMYAMNTLSVQVLENILEFCGISKDDMNTITGGALENQAGHVATINHYRTEKETIGLVGHKDSGYVTLLYANLPGCELKINDEWYSIDPKDGYFIALAGHVLEILTENLNKPITAPEHRVRQLFRREGIEDRISVSIFVTPRYDANLYQYDSHGALKIYRDYLTFLKEDFRKINYSAPKLEGVSE